MPNPSSYLKKRIRIPKLTFIAVGALVLAWVNLGIPVSLAAYREIPIPAWVTSAVMALISSVLGAIDSAPGKWKDVLVFRRLRNPLPGTRAFTKEILGQDPRINVEALRAAVGRFPRSAQEQNAAWYKLYKSIEADPRVEGAHCDYLLYRDLTWFSLLFLLIGLANAAINLRVWQAALCYAGAFVALHFLFARAARERGSRFVCTVLALVSVTPSQTSTPSGTASAPAAAPPNAPASPSKKSKKRTRANNRSED